MNMLGVIEGILFVVGDEGITLGALSETINKPVDETKQLLLELKKMYESEKRGIRISYLGDAFKLTTKKEHKDFYQRLIENPESNTLSQAALEVLAIVAYNQPITRIEIDEIRGVSSIHMIRKLLAKNLLKESGKSTLPGRPNLYATTKDFLDFFGLSTINDLPKLPEENQNIEDDVELFSSIYKEPDE